MQSLITAGYQTFHPLCATALRGGPRFIKLSGFGFLEGPPPDLQFGHVKLHTAWELHCRCFM